MYLLEIACFNPGSAIIAQDNGADRVELCYDIKSGGITPPLKWIIETRKVVQIALNIMVRPRPGSFVYNAHELDDIRRTILFGKELGLNGFVFGVLGNDGNIDIEKNKFLTELAHPLPCTFHRAFDEMEDKAGVLEALIKCGFKRLLTSGGNGNAVNFSSGLKALIQQANGRISIMPGGGIRSSNINSLLETGASEFHSAAITDHSDVADGKEIKRLKSLLG
jgi:copper homeostasis protein